MLQNFPEMENTCLVSKEVGLTVKNALNRLSKLDVPVAQTFKMHFICIKCLIDETFCFYLFSCCKKCLKTYIVEFFVVFNSRESRPRIPGIGK